MASWFVKYGRLRLLDLERNLLPQLKFLDERGQSILLPQNATLFYFEPLAPRLPAVFGHGSPLKHL